MSSAILTDVMALSAMSSVRIVAFKISLVPTALSAMSSASIVSTAIFSVVMASAAIFPVVTAKSILPKF